MPHDVRFLNKPTNIRLTNGCDVKLTSLKQNIKKLQKVVENGTFSIEIAGLSERIHVTRNQTLIFEVITLADIGESAKEEKKEIGFFFTILGVVLGVGIIIGALFIAKKYRSPRRPRDHNHII